VSASLKIGVTRSQGPRSQCRRSVPLCFWKTVVHRYPSGGRADAQKAAKDTKTDQELGFCHDPALPRNGARETREKTRKRMRGVGWEAHATSRDPTFDAVGTRSCAIRRGMSKKRATAIFDLSLRVGPGPQPRRFHDAPRVRAPAGSPTLCFLCYLLFKLFSLLPSVEVGTSARSLRLVISVGSAAG